VKKKWIHTLRCPAPNGMNIFDWISIILNIWFVPLQIFNFHHILHPNKVIFKGLCIF
jgi:hypothetical protein